MESQEYTRERVTVKQVVTRAVACHKLTIWLNEQYTC